VTFDGHTSGYVHARGRDYALRVVGPLRSAGCRVDVCDELAELLRGSEAIVAQRLAQSRDASEFVVELAELIEQLPAAEAAGSLPSQAFYAQLLDELDAIGWQLLTDVSASLDLLELTLPDVAGRLHTCSIRLPMVAPKTTK
jgi:hypothetical protein